MTACPEGRGCALRRPGGEWVPVRAGPGWGSGRALGRPSTGSGGTRGRVRAGQQRGSGARRAAGAWPRGARARLEAAGGRQAAAHSPSLAFFFLASVPPSLPRNDSSFFILCGRGPGERSGAEDMGRARAQRVWEPPRSPPPPPARPGSGREGAAATPAPAPRPPPALERPAPAVGTGPRSELSASPRGLPAPHRPFPRCAPRSLSEK